MELRILDLEVFIQGTRILTGINGSLMSGQVTTLLGPNGSGKTTLIRILLGDHDTPKGFLEVVENQSKRRFDPHRFHLGFIPDEKMNMLITGREYIYFINRFYKQTLDTHLLDALLDVYNMEKDIDRHMKYYSTGMTKKTYIIAALVHNPKILLFDEPFTGLDPDMIIVTKKIIQQLKHLSRCILISSHQLGVVENITDGIFLLRNGKQTFFGEIEEFYKKYEGLTLEDTWSNILANEYDLDKKVQTISQLLHNL